MPPREEHTDGGSERQPAGEADESDLVALRDRVDELDAAVQAIRGLLGEVRAVDRDVERRADLALARTDRLRSRLDAVASAVDDDLADSAVVEAGPDGADGADAGDRRRAVDAEADRHASRSGAEMTGREGTVDVTADTGTPSFGSDRDPAGDEPEDVADSTDEEEWGLAERLRETL